MLMFPSRKWTGQKGNTLQNVIKTVFKRHSLINIVCVCVIRAFLQHGVSCASNVNQMAESSKGGVFHINIDNLNTKMFLSLLIGFSQSVFSLPVVPFAFKNVQ